MKNYNCPKLIMLSFLIVCITISVNGQNEYELLDHSSDTIAVTEQGLYVHQNNVYKNYKSLKPILFQFPESKRQYKKARRSIFSVAPIVLTGLTYYSYLAVDHALSCLITELVNNNCETIYKSNPKIFLSYTIMGIGVYNLISFKKKKNKSITTFNKLMQSKE